MPAPSMPSGIQPIASGYSFGAPGGVRRSDVAGGIARYALEWDGGVQTFSITLLLTRTEFSVWNAFFHRKIDKGAVAFTMPLDSGFGLQPHLVNIVPGTYTVAEVNVAMASVRFDVEAESQAYLLDDDEADALLAMHEAYRDGIQSLLDRLATFANGDTNVLAFA